MRLPLLLPNLLPYSEKKAKVMMIRTEKGDLKLSNSYSCFNEVDNTISLRQIYCDAMRISMNKTMQWEDA